MLIAGADGEKSQFPNGLQSDHLSEQTVGHGTRVRGISDPTTYPVIAGDVGETVRVAGSGTVTPVGASQWTTVVSATLQPGKWLLMGKVFQSNAATPPTTYTMLISGLHTAANAGSTDWNSNSPIAGANFWNTMSVPPIIVTISTATVYYLNSSINCAAINTAVFDGASSYIQAVRIA